MENMVRFYKNNKMIIAINFDDVRKVYSNDIDGCNNIVIEFTDSSTEVLRSGYLNAEKIIGRMLDNNTREFDLDEFPDQIGD